jgi:hypothetical protein
MAWHYCARQLHEDRGPARDGNHAPSGNAGRIKEWPELSGDFCPIPYGPVCAASTPRGFPQTRHGEVLIHARYLGFRPGLISASLHTSLRCNGFRLGYRSWGMGETARRGNRRYVSAPWR